MAHYTDPDKQTRVISKPFKQGVPKPTKKVIIIVLAVIAVGIVAWLAYNHFQKQNDKYSTACTDKSANGVLDKSVAYLQPQQHLELGKLVDQISTLPDVDKDPNCLAVMVTYYINITDQIKAKQYYDQLKLVYQPKKGYDNAIKGKVMTPEAMGPIVDFLQKQAENFKKNSYYGAGEP